MKDVVTSRTDITPIRLDVAACENVKKIVYIECLKHRCSLHMCHGSGDLGFGGLINLYEGELSGCCVDERRGPCQQRLSGQLLKCFEVVHACISAPAIVGG